ncbi:MAG: hypothetical protein KKC01_10360 [Gammaproteobacteria bacterium]|nr:hypothetical protein [Gammaproteobacteria bacterium]
MKPHQRIPVQRSGRRPARLFSVVLCTALLLFALTAEAITLKQAARQVARQYDGKVVAARTIEQNGRRIHVIRVVTKQGVVKTVRIPE